MSSSVGGAVDLESPDQLQVCACGTLVVAVHNAGCPLALLDAELGE